MAATPFGLQKHASNGMRSRITTQPDRIGSDLPPACISGVSAYARKTHATESVTSPHHHFRNLSGQKNFARPIFFYFRGSRHVWQSGSRR